MTDKLEQLTQQIYKEGVLKARDEAASIIAGAEDEKKRLLRAARQEAEDIIAVAHKEAADLKKRGESEMRMTASQTLALLRQEITDMICVKVAEDASQGLFKDAEFLKQMISIIMKTWAESGCQEQGVYLKLPEDKRGELEEYFFQKGKETLTRGVTVAFDAKIKSGFTITPHDGSYRIGFTEDDFNALIQYFLRPRMKQFLFGEKPEK